MIDVYGAAGGAEYATTLIGNGFDIDVQNLLIFRDRVVVVRTNDGPQDRIAPYIFPDVCQPYLVLIIMCPRNRSIPLWTKI